jgi:aminopeptidase-like protein
MGLGNIMYGWACDLFPINRSLTGNGVRKTLNYIKEILPELQIKEVNSGDNYFDWTIPKEWDITEAYIEDENGNIIVDFIDNNLHVMGYSLPIDLYLTLEELNPHIYSLVDLPDAIPYITSYYEENWGFCMSQNQRDTLKEGMYHVVIKSRLFDGVMNYGEIVLSGKSDKEILLSTYICHPSMANNEISGPVVTIQLVKWLKEIKNRNYTYRIIFIPETIGAIVYLAKDDMYKHLSKNVIAGFQITCVGDNNSISFMPSRYGNTYADAVARYVLDNSNNSYLEFSFLDRASDERQWCSPGIDLPVVSLMRTKYGEYEEYHTSLDNLNYISKEGLELGYLNIKNCLDIIEQNCVYKLLILGEPQLGKRNLYPTISMVGSKFKTKAMMNVLAYSDGKNSVLDIAKIIKVEFKEVLRISKMFENIEILKKLEYFEK